MVPHAFWNPGDESAKLLEIISPAGFEEYFRELAPLLGGDGPPDVAALGALQARYEVTMDFSTIDSLRRRTACGRPSSPAGAGVRSAP